MGLFLGVDTSNYTTSVALYDNQQVAVEMERQLLPVAEGQLGLRQNDAVFAHVKQLPVLLHRLRERMPGDIQAVGVSTRPRDAEGSYMPCFLVGEMVGSVAADVLNVPLYCYSHQAGHVGAAIWGTGDRTLFTKEFCAFHVSGGTTECVFVRPSKAGFQVEMVARSLDLKAGQAVDRIGKLLGLPFPAGPRLEKLAEKSDKTFSYKVSAKGGDVSMSGLENRCMRLHEEGAPDCDVAKLCLEGVLANLRHMAVFAREKFGDETPLLFAGGVMSNRFLQSELKKLPNTCFSDPAFCGDNAAGLAILAARHWLFERGHP